MNHRFRITALEPASFDEVPLHHATAGITRLKAASFPAHVAVHVIDGRRDSDAPYIEPHCHAFDEVNVLLGEGMRYRMQIGEETHEVVAPANVWIGKGVPHAANHLAGNGFFVCLHLPPAETVAEVTDAGTSS